jgi:multiple sugar transport system ATP-binding protein
MSALDIENIRKTYGEVETLKGIDISLESGEFLVLLGSSGCGKSTLLNIIAGLAEATSGGVRIGGRSVLGVHPKDRDIAMVFQSYALYPNLTVHRNIGFGLEMRKVPAGERDKAVRDAAKLLQIENLLDRKPSQLSGGQRQRVAIGRALVRKPEVFLFDEPLSNLDAKLRVTMRVEIKELHQRLKTTTIYVTHDQIEAMTMADKIVVMRDGRVEQIGAPLDLYDRPANIFVAGFIGSPSMNFVPGRLSMESGRLAFVSDKGTVLPVPEGTSSHGEPVIYGIRPEHIDVRPEGMPATISVLEPTGSETQIFAHLGGDAIMAAVRDRIAALPGEAISLRFDPARVHLFDAKSGRRL